MPLLRPLITRAALQDVAKIIQTGSFDSVPQDDEHLGSYVLWDNISGVWNRKKKIALPGYFHVNKKRIIVGSRLHRWIVLISLEAVQNRSYAREEGTAINAAQRWIQNPTEENLIAVSTATQLSNYPVRFILDAITVKCHTHPEGRNWVDASGIFHSAGGEERLMRNGEYGPGNYPGGITEPACWAVSSPLGAMGYPDPVLIQNNRTIIRVLAALEEHLPEPTL